MCADPESAKRIDNFTTLFALWGSFCVKAALKMLVKLTPEPQKSLPLWTGRLACNHMLSKVFQCQLLPMILETLWGP